MERGAGDVVGSGRRISGEGGTHLGDPHTGTAGILGVALALHHADAFEGPEAADDR